MSAARMPAGRGWAATALALVLAGVLVLTQALSLMHSLAHGAHAESGAGQEAGSGWVHALFSAHDDGEGACRLLDQQAHGDLLPALALPAPAVLCGLFIAAAWRVRICVAAQAAFEARGPPAGIALLS